MAFKTFNIIFAVVLVSSAASTQSQTISGQPKILSGDTLSVGGMVLHLNGIEAPEMPQMCRAASGRAFDCGLVSKTALMDLTVAVSVSCRLTGGKRQDLPEAQCFAAGYDLSKGMVHTGWALAWPRSGTVYSIVENSARNSSRGMWRGKFITPWDWRSGNRLAEQSP
jgi:endonuclease YncB( thermonuclease family)